MSNPTIRIHDMETNEIIDREMTDEEFAAHKATEAAAKARSESDANRQALIESRNAKLEALGLTAEELNL